MGAGPLQKDVWHREALTLARRNGIALRRWGMRVTVYGDSTPSNNGDYVLTYDLASTNKASNSNWLKVAEIGETWGGGGVVYTFSNGLTLTGDDAKLGGTLTQNTTIDGDGGDYAFGVTNASDITLEAESILSLSFDNGAFSGNYLQVLTSDLDLSADSGMAIGAGTAINAESPVIEFTASSEINLLTDTAHIGDGTNGIFLNGGSLSIGEISGFYITGDGGFAGAQYDSDYFGNYTDRSLADWGNVINQIGGNAVDALIKSPTVSQNGYQIAWNNSNLEYELVAPGGSYTFSNGLTLTGSAVTFGGALTANTFVPSGATPRTLYFGVTSGFVEQPLSTIEFLTNNTFVVYVGSTISGSHSFLMNTGGALSTNTLSTATNNTNINFSEKTVHSTGTVAANFGGREQIALEVAAGGTVSAITNEYKVISASGTLNFQWNICKTTVANPITAADVILSFNTTARNIGFNTNDTGFGSGEGVFKMYEAATDPTAGVTDSALVYTSNGELQVLNATGPAQSLGGRANVVTPASGSVTLTQAHRGATVVVAGASPVITLSDLGVAFQCNILFIGTGTLTFTGYTNFRTPGGVQTVTTQYGWVYLYHSGTNTWYGNGTLV